MQFAKLVIRRRRQAMASTIPEQQFLENVLQQQAAAVAMNDAAGPVTGDRNLAAPIDITVDQAIRASVQHTFSSSGTSWLNNIQEIVGGIPDSNQFSSFAWEFMNIWMDPRQAQEINSKYYLYRPTSVKVTFSNPQMYQMSNTGATPVMLQSFNGKFCAVVDQNYMNCVDCCPYALGSASSTTSLITGGSIGTLAFIRTLHQSYQQGGYSSDIQIFQPNGMVAIVDNGMLGVNNAMCKTMKMGQGCTLDFTWRYNNNRWRQTAELGMSAIQKSSTRYLVGGIPYLNSPRSDEAFGQVVNNIYTNTDTDSYTIFLPNSPDFNDLSSATGVGSLPAQTTPHMPCITDTPQPKLLLHIVPDIGVLGTAGTCQCQFDFKIEWTFETKGAQHRIGNTTIAPFGGGRIQPPFQGINALTGLQQIQPQGVYYTLLTNGFTT